MLRDRSFIIFMSINYFQVLNISLEATEEEIKASYREKIRKLHPDSSAFDSSVEGDLNSVQEAFQTLLDCKRREEERQKILQHNVYCDNQVFSQTVFPHDLERIGNDYLITCRCGYEIPLDKHSILIDCSCCSTTVKFDLSSCKCQTCQQFL